jgi:hypothetical protein
MALDPVTAALDIGGKLIDRLWPDPAQRDAAKLELLRLQQSGDLAQMTGQLEINKVEAGSASAFTSGWRPAIGWTCGAGFAVQFVIGPLGEWVCAVAGHPVKFPAMDLGTMMPLLFGMLGLGAYRTTEKIRGVA